jgi:hypothetical protein
MKKGYKFVIRYPREFTSKMKEHLEKVRPKNGYPLLTNSSGRPTKENIVKKYKLEHPNSSRYKCAKDTGLDYKTVSKWWD